MKITEGYNIADVLNVKFSTNVLLALEVGILKIISKFA